MKFIRCVDDLLETIEFIKLRSENFAFRGQVNQDWSITSTIMRDDNGEPRIYKNSRRRELASLKPLIEGKKSSFSRTYHPLEHLMQLQHHSVSTRLIDWTRDALVGLFFSCFDKSNKWTDKHGKIILLLIEKNEFEHLDIFYDKQNMAYREYDINLIKKSLDQDLMQLSEIKIIEHY